jgi:3-oxoacyl-[acyl-carrier protein] reductase
LLGKVVVVTGGASGIGRETAAEFRALGANLVIIDKNRDGALKSASELGPNALGISSDVSEPSSISQAFNAVASHFGKLDVLVHCAGVGLQKQFLETTFDDWNRIISVNLTGTFLTCQAAARLMICTGHGRIINISSVAGERGGTGRAAYGASKAGQTILTKVTAVELASLGITVNAIAPGAIDTALVAKMHTPVTREAYVRSLAIKRYGTPSEVAAAVLFLASEAARYITGEVLHVDGGFSAAGVMF